MGFMKLLAISILLLAMVSCSSRNNHTLINENTMVDVLVDIHLADATLTVANLRIKVDTTIIKLYYADVLKKHHITQKQFDNSLKYYSSKPKEFEKIYENVSEKLAKLESEFEQNVSIEREKAKNATIKKDSVNVDTVKAEQKDYE